MIPPEAVADLAIFLCRGDEASIRPARTFGTRLYRSIFDPFGVSYAPLEGGERFIDLVGQAYRRAGAQLLGLAWPRGRLPFLDLSEEDWRNLEKLAVTPKNGGGANVASPALAAALTPFKVYQEEMERQQVLGRDKNEAEACFEAVAQGFRAGLKGLGLAG
jgi:hypothetical protein